jgi:hypothetical protein
VSRSAIGSGLAKRFRKTRRGRRQHHGRLGQRASGAAGHGGGHRGAGARCLGRGAPGPGGAAARRAGLRHPGGALARPAGGARGLEPGRRALGGGGGRPAARSDWGVARLRYDIEHLTCATGPQNQTVALTTTPCRFGGLRWWWRCPETGGAAPSSSCPTAAGGSSAVVPTAWPTLAIGGRDHARPPPRRARARPARER